ncbi:hypothetical protein AB0C07_39260 [Actinoplanes missouriensis]|uniref:hypothetical protein n=1 Tax=Actinoplanes missouriensis TaxID=1866 RepID=UPI0033FEDD63
MTSTGNVVKPSGMVTGSLIAISFGTVFILVNSGGLPTPWPLIIRVAGVLAAAVLLVALFRKARIPTNAGGPADINGFTDRRYWIIVAAEVVALFGGLFLINSVWERPELAIAWIATVVGVHFFALAWAWRLPLFHGLGAVMTVLGLAGFVIAASGGSEATIALVAGVGSGVALLATVAVALRRAAG